MNKYKKPQYKEEDLGISPFVTSLVVNVNEIAYKQNYKKEDGIILPKYGKVEIDDYCKVYISASRRKVMNELTARGKELLLWIIYEVDPNKDYLWVNKNRYMYENGIGSVNTYKAALAEVMKAGFICASPVKDVYWINPAMFYSGNRITQFPKNVQILYSEKEK